MSDVPKVHFAKLGDDRIAYQVLGDGPLDLMWVTGMGEALDARWEYGPCVTFMRRLASFSRLIMFDRRGMGASDPVPLEALPNWEEWADDALAVLDAVGSERPVVLGATDSGPPAIMFAAVHPQRTHSLIVFNSMARGLVDDDYPWGRTPETARTLGAFMVEHWGTEEGVVDMGVMGEVDAEEQRITAKAMRMSCSPREAGAHIRQMEDLDIRSALSSVQVPTLVLHRANALYVTADEGRYLAEHIPGARYVEVPGADLMIFRKPSTFVLDEIESFVTGSTATGDTNRVLATILLTDIVGSTERATRLGDRGWRRLLESHDAVSGSVIDEYGGRVIKLTGDGVLSTFDGPGRAIRCAIALGDALRPLGIQIRAGLHTGEVEVRGTDIAGIGVHIAARVTDASEPGEMLVSPPVPVLVAGAGFEFEDRGDHELKGVPGTWRLYAVSA